MSVPSPDAQFRVWLDAADQAEERRDDLIGERVRYVGMTGRATGPVGRITRVCRDGLRVRWEGDQHAEIVHPEDVAWIEP